MTARTWVIVNPAAGNGRAGRRWPALAEALRRAGIDFTPCVTCGPGDGARCAHFAAEDGADLIAVVGGDGTLNEVVNGLFAAGGEAGGLPMLALWPVGTGADFARGLGISRQSPAGLPRGEARAVDVGRARYRTADGGAGERYFVNVADFGLGPATSRHIARGPRCLGPVGYLYGALRAIAAHEPARVLVEVDGEPVYAGASAIVVVANGSHFGGGMHVAPLARLDDGLFDVLVLEETSRRALVSEILPRIYRGTHLRHPAIHHHRGSRVSVDAASPFPFEVDGEAAGTTPVTLELLPRAARVVTPGA